MKHDLIIIGGGASGIFAAIIAKDFGIDVAIVESNNRIGKKILTTGNGRCNISNTNIEYNKFHSNNLGFPNYILSKFTSKDTEEFFKSLGLNLVDLDSGKLYPLSLQASSVLDIFLMALADRNIPVYLSTNVNTIKQNSDGFEIKAFPDSTFTSKTVILATGGNSAPNTGSDGSGYTLAQNLGHSIVKPLPALVQLKLDYNKLKAISGVKFNGKATIIIENKEIQTDFGEILFTDYGISGPPILQLSRIASSALWSKKNVHIKIDLMNNLTYDELKDMLENHWGILSYRSLYNSLIGIINKKLIPIILKEANVDNIHKPCWEITWKEKNSILKLLKEWTFKVTDTNGFKNSQVTAGGIDTSEVDSHTLHSKIIPGLYFTGEILDVDGDCGGFNLQWAWSSAAIAAKACFHENHK